MPNDNLITLRDGCDITRKKHNEIVTQFQNVLSSARAKTSHFLGYQLAVRPVDCCVPAELREEVIVMQTPGIASDLSPEEEDAIKRPNGMRQERIVVDWLKSVWKAHPREDYWGYVATGSSEAMLLGVLLGRDKFPKAPLLMCRNAHHGYTSAAWVARVNIKLVPMDDRTGEMQYDALESIVRDELDPASGVIVALTSITTMHGASDNVQRVIDTLYRHGFSDEQFYLHQDAAQGGLIFPYLDEVPDDLQVKFRSNGKPNSISISLQKQFRVGIVGGVFVGRREDRVTRMVEYLSAPGGTPSGTRNALPALMAYGAMQSHGDEGYRRDARNVVERARKYYGWLVEKGVDAFLHDHSNLLCLYDVPKDIIHKYKLATEGHVSHAIVMVGREECIFEELVKDLARGSILA